MGSLLHIDIFWCFTIVFAIFIGYIVKQLILRLLSPLNKIPGPSTWSPLGNLSTIIKEPPADPYITWSQQFGGIIRYTFPIYDQRIAIVDPEYIKHVLVTQCSKYCKPSQTKTFLIDIVGEGLLLLEGQKHAKARKIINPTFKYNKIKEMIPIFQTFSQALVDYWKLQIADQSDQVAVLDIHKDLTRTTLDIICKCAFDYDCQALEDSNNKISAAFARVLGGLSLNWTYFIPGFKYLPTSSNLEAKDALSVCHNTIRKVIKDKLEKGVTGQETCLLDILLSLKDEENNVGFTNAELQDHIMTFMSAGHETTSVALAWTLYALAKHPVIQDKVRQDIHRVMQQGDNVTWNTFDELTYLDNVLKESLRLYPPVPLTFRQAIVDDQIGDYFIPKGTTIAIIPPHRSPNYFQDPLKFDPDRWESTAKNLSPYAYLPFLRGPRICIGSKFAVTEMKCILSLLLRHFSFKPCPDREVKRKLHITMRPNPYLKLIVSPLLSD